MTLRRFLGVLVVAAMSVVSGCGGDVEARPDLAFVSSRDGDYAIYEMDADGSGQRRLTDHEADASSPARLFFQIEPAWSPDGSRIAFASRRTGTYDIYVMNADGTGTTRLTSGKETDSHPSWSPDGDRIVFERDNDIFVMNADGSGARSISDPVAEESEPAWSPGGELVVYVRRTPGTAVRELWLMRPDGSERRALTSTDARVTNPAWSPDGSRIAFASNLDGELYELYTVNTDGEQLRSVAPTTSDNFEPAWSPDGSTMAYQEDGAIFTIELGSEDVERLTDYEDNDSFPVWNPVLSGK